jgi:hypothetical protein
VEYPAAYPEVIAVGASTDVDVRASYSQYGPELDVLAPSSGGWRDIVTTDLVGSAGDSDTDFGRSFGGTSSASPLAAGVGALLLSSNPGLGSEDLRQLLQQTCDRIGSDTYVSGRNDLYGYGRLNAARALQRLDVLRFEVTSLPPAAPIGKEFSFSATLTNRGNVLINFVSITNLLPDYAQLVSLSQSQGSSSQTGGEVVFQLGSLAPGAGARVEVVLNPTEQGTMVHRYVVATNNTWGYSLTRNVVAELPRLQIHDTTVVEGNEGTTNAAFVLSLTAPLKVPLTVHFSTWSGFLDVDPFVPTNGVVTFPAGSTNEVVSVQVRGDVLDEDSEGFFLSLESEGDIIVDDGIGFCEIIDDDDPPTVSVVPTSAPEGRRGAREVLVELALSAPSAKAVSVKWATRQGTALSGKDFQAATGTVHFAVGAQSETLSLQILGNRSVEADKQLFVYLFSPVACTLGNSNGVVTILNDDGLPGILDHFGIITTSEPHYSNEPFPLQILAVDSEGDVVSQFAEPVSLRFAFTPIVMLSNSFEQGLNGFVVSNSFGNGKGLWHWSSGRASAEGHSRTHSIYYGRGESVAGGGNYNVGTNEGFFVTPPVDLRGSSLNATLAFSYFMQVQTNELRDLATVEISTNAGLSYVILAKASGTPDTNFVKDTKGKWQRATFDLTPFVGNVILLSWHFNSVDSLLNATEGWYVDDIVVTLGSNPASVIQPAVSGDFVDGRWIGAVSIGGPIKSGKLVVEYDVDYISESGAFEIRPFSDVNANGLPDQWESGFPFPSAAEAKAEADPDGDGASNRLEYQAGTDPLDRLSVLRISRSWLSDGHIRLEFPTRQGRFYKVESSDSFNPMLWESSGGPVLGDGNPYEWVDAFPAKSPLHIHRLRLLP